MMPKNPFIINLEEKFEHLDSSPIVEAVIHWTAKAGTTLQDIALRQQLSELVPEYPHVQSQHWRQMESILGPRATSHRVDEGWHGLRLASDDKLFVAQFTSDGLVFSRLEPYHSWEQFSDEALRLWNVFCELATPVDVQRLGVRFINRVPLNDIGQVRKFLSQTPKCLEGMQLPSESFIYQSTHRVPDRPYCLNVTRTVPPANLVADGKVSLIVDIDAFTTAPFEIDEQASREHLANLRWLKNKAFFSLMTKRALAGFAKQRGD